MMTHRHIPPLLALVLAAAFPLSRMPVVIDQSVQRLLVTTPGLDPPWLFGIRGLLYALAIHGLWCMALMPKTCTCRHGVGKGIRYMFASMIRPARRSRTTRDRWPRPAATRLAVVAIVGWVGILLVWCLSGIYWHGLLTALVGLAGGGLVVWTVRLVSRWSLGREAMGFGDVTLLAMIGAFVGWQAAVLVFFLAPLAGVVVGLLQLVTTRQTEMAFGPYLCLATVGVMLAWPALWHGYAADVFAMGWIIHKKGMNATIPSIIALATLYFFVWIGTMYPVDFQQIFGMDKQSASNSWIYLLFFYSLL